MANVYSRAEFWKRHDALKAKHSDNAEFAAAAMLLHREYFGAYVRDFKIKAPAHLIEACRKALMAGDQHFNSPFTQIKEWDACMPLLAYVPGLTKTLRDNGEGWSHSVSICLLKEAMRQHLDTARAYDAAATLRQIADCPAFSIPDAKRQKLNRHSTLYTFADGSCLQINATRSRADAWQPAWTGSATDIHLGPIKGAALRINRQGA